MWDDSSWVLGALLLAGGPGDLVFIVVAELNNRILCAIISRVESVT